MGGELIITNADAGGRQLSIWTNGKPVLILTNGLLGIGKEPSGGYGTVQLARDLCIGQTASLLWYNGSQIYSTADGIISFVKLANKDFTGIILGTNSDSGTYSVGYPRINRDGAGISITDQAGVVTGTNNLTVGGTITANNWLLSGAGSAIGQNGRAYWYGPAANVEALTPVTSTADVGLVIGTNSVAGSYTFGYPRLNRHGAGLSLTDQTGVMTATNTLEVGGLTVGTNGTPMRKFLTATVAEDGTILAGGTGISNVIRQANGVYQVNFMSAMASTNYLVNLTPFYQTNAPAGRRVFHGYTTNTLMSFMACFNGVAGGGITNSFSMMIVDQ